MIGYTCANCVFCTRHEQPAALFETPHLYVMPDKFPLTAGHVLIISREHLRCYATASPKIQSELDETAIFVGRFVRETYSAPAVIFENGVVGQSVFHAHLHLLSLPIPELPVEVIEHSDVTLIDDWRAVKEYCEGYGRYFHLQFGDRRYLISSSESPVLPVLRRIAAQALGLAFGERGFVKITTPADVENVHCRWCEWRSKALNGSGTNPQIFLSAG